MKPHIEFAHSVWKTHLTPGDHVIDATCGNGKDALQLSRLIFNEDRPGKLYAIDIQEIAIEKSRQFLSDSLSPETFKQIVFIHGSHACFPSFIPENTIKLIVYNLGYLPGGDKNRTTLHDQTLASIKHAKSLLGRNGFISITCYPGHPEGKIEEEKVLEYASLLDKGEWSSSHHRWTDKPSSPSVLLLFKKPVK